MTSFKNDDQPPYPDIDRTEARMRLALGVSTPSQAPHHNAPQPRSGPHGQRHRFVRDGEVQVVVNNARREPERDANLTAEANQRVLAEREGRERAEQSLKQAQARIQTLLTQLVHAQLAHEEALTAERNAHELTQIALRNAEAARTAAEQKLEQSSSTDDSRGVKSKPRKPVAQSEEDLAESVQWWVPGWREKFRNQKS